jgi:formylglycine-generating enzyme required for sulfatase activity
VVRGGSWDGNANYCRAAARSNGTPGITYYYSPGVRNDDLGFRPALVSSK